MDVYSAQVYDSETESAYSTDDAICSDVYNASTLVDYDILESSDSDMETSATSMIDNFLKVARWLDSLGNNTQWDVVSMTVDHDVDSKNSEDESESDSKPFMMDLSASTSSGSSSPDENKKKALSNIFGNLSRSHH